MRVNRKHFNIVRMIVNGIRGSMECGEDRGLPPWKTVRRIRWREMMRIISAKGLMAQR